MKVQCFSKARFIMSIQEFINYLFLWEIIYSSTRKWLHIYIYVCYIYTYIYWILKRGETKWKTRDIFYDISSLSSGSHAWKWSSREAQFQKEMRNLFLKFIRCPQVIFMWYLRKFSSTRCWIFTIYSEKSSKVTFYNIFRKSSKVLNGI